MLDANKTILQLRDPYNHPFRIPHNAFSIEIECEGNHLALPTGRTPLWDITNDHSLRGESCEYRLIEPVPITKLKDVLDQWNILQQKSDINYRSKRTSTHVHVNFNDKTILQTFTACVTFWFLENLLLKFCDEDRTANLFCLRLEDANEHLADILNVARNKKQFPNMWYDNGRYANLNLMALSKFGSLEVRCMDGNASRPRLDMWIKTIHSILTKSIAFENPAKLLEFYDQHGPEALLKFLLPIDIVDYWLEIPNSADYIDENYSFLLLIVSSTGSWDEYDEDFDKDNQDLMYQPLNNFLNPYHRDGDEEANERLQQEEEELAMEMEDEDADLVANWDDEEEEEEGEED